MKAALHRRTARDQRGVALLLALVMVVLMTATITEFNYSARARILSASHARDDMRSLYLARSGVRIYGLLLSFGQQLGSNPMLSGLLGQIGLNIDGATMVCKNLPFLDTAMLRVLAGTEGDSEEAEAGLMSLLGLGGEDGAGDGTAKAPDATPASRRGAIDETKAAEPEGLRRGMLDFDGDFKVECDDESGKIDLNGLAEAGYYTLPLQEHPIALMLYGLMAPHEYDDLFEERLKIDRWELIANIRDYVDPDQERSHTLGGDEARSYDDFEPRYKPKDRMLDTVAEARMIAGVNDEVWATFGPYWSVHNKSYQVNVNTAQPVMLWALVRAFSDPALVPDDLIQQRVQMMIVERMLVPFANADQFMQRVEAPFTPATGASLPGIPLLKKDQMKRLLTTKSTVFRMRSTGYVGDSARSLDVIVRMNRWKPRFLDWREY